MEKNEFQKPNPELIVLSHADKRPTSSNQIYSAERALALKQLYVKKAAHDIEQFELGVYN